MNHQGTNTEDGHPSKDAIAPPSADSIEVGQESGTGFEVGQAGATLAVGQEEQLQVHHHRQDHHEDPTLTNTNYSVRWSNLIKSIHKPITKFMHTVSQPSARHPKKSIAAAVSFSFLLLFLGYATNFDFDVDEDILWTPRNSYPITHSQWLQNETGFPDFARFVAVLFHAEGATVISNDYMTRVFEAVGILRDVDGYDKACSDSDFENNRKKNCEISGVVQFWNYSSTIYHETVNSEIDLQIALSKPTFPDGRFVDENSLFGYPERDPTTGLLTSAYQIRLLFDYPTLHLQKTWKERLWKQCWL